MKLYKTIAERARRASVAKLNTVRDWATCLGSGWVGSGSGIGTVLVLASLALTVGPSAASDSNWSGSIHVDDLLDPGRSELLVEVPQDGLYIDLWSDPEAGSRVRVGQKANIYFEANANCYVTILSVDTEGRTSRLFPRHRQDGWVWGGETYRLPEYDSRTDLRFSGPKGVERVFAIASLSSQREFYPAWLEHGRASSWARASCTYDSAFYETGWMLGDPLFELRGLTKRLVSYPRDYDSYSTAWANFYVGHSRHHRRHAQACARCGGLVEAGHDGCGGGYVSVSLEPDFGWIDFSVVVLPRYHYRACRTWRPRLWVNVFHDPYPGWRWCDWRVSRRGHGKGRVYHHYDHGWREPDGRYRDRVERRHKKETIQQHADRHDRSRTGEAWGRGHGKNRAEKLHVEKNRTRRTPSSQSEPRTRIRGEHEKENGRKGRDAREPRRSAKVKKQDLAPSKAEVERRDRHGDRKIVEKVLKAENSNRNEKSVRKSKTKTGSKARTQTQGKSRAKKSGKERPKARTR